MSDSTFSVRQETPADACAIEALTQIVFGPAMKARAAYALREGVSHDAGLSFVAERAGELIGTVRLTPILWGEQKVQMLGPLGVLKEHSGQGAGAALMHAAVNAAGERKGAEGTGAIVLVGDLAYYEPFGFQRIPAGRITLPRPADPMRILACELVPGALAKLEGAAQRCRA